MQPCTTASDQYNCVLLHIVHIYIMESYMHIQELTVYISWRLHEATKGEQRLLTPNDCICLSILSYNLCLAQAYPVT